jgi:gliding motility-associated-like protein
VQTNLAPEQIGLISWMPAEIENCLDSKCRQIRFSLSESTRIEVTVMDTNGCVAGDILSILVVDDRQVYVPNIFSPNGDGQNDVFTLFAGSGVRLISSLSIFSRWGDLLFVKENISPNDLTSGWDGTQDGRALDPGVFVWKAKIEYQNGTERIMHGDVTLLR